MGEYAKFSGKEVKIGTCGALYYLRWNQRHLVEPLSGNVNPITQVDKVWYRLPLVEEDGIAPGYFEYYHAQGTLGSYGAKPVRFLCRKGKETELKGVYEETEFAKTLREYAMQDPGNSQIYNNNVGVLCNVPCYHGHSGKLPDRMGYNGLTPNTYAIFALGIRKNEAMALVGCVACGETFAMIGLDEIKQECLPYFSDDEENWNAIIRTMEDMEATINDQKGSGTKNG